MDFIDKLLNPVEAFQEAVNDFFTQLALGFVEGAVGLIKIYMIDSTNLKKLPIPIETIQTFATSAGAMIAMIFLYLRLLQALRDQVTDEAQPNYAEILGSFTVSLAFIVATPYIITELLIPINNQVVNWIVNLKLSDQITLLDFRNPIETYIKHTTVPLAFLLAILVWAIAFIGLGIVSAIRYAEIVFLLVVGPILQSSYTNRSDVMRTYWIKTIAVIFTQPIQVFLLWSILISMLSLTWNGVLLSFGFTVLALRGPAILERLIYTTGVGPAGTRVMGFMTYQFLTRSMFKK